jgi:hypothetical protein
MATSKNMMEVFRLTTIVVFLALIACAKPTTPERTGQTPTGILVTVVDYTGLDGCTYLLQQADGQKLQPVNLGEEFRKNDLKLYVTFKNHDGVSTCMAGKMVTLTDVKVADDIKNK